MEKLGPVNGKSRFDFYNKPNSQLDLAGGAIGISFNKTRRVINSVDCQRLMEWTYESQPDKANELMERMFVAYFVEARNLGQEVEILRVVEQVCCFCCCWTDSHDRPLTTTPVTLLLQILNPTSLTPSFLPNHTP